MSAARTLTHALLATTALALGCAAGPSHATRSSETVFFRTRTIETTRAHRCVARRGPAPGELALRTRNGTAAAPASVAPSAPPAVAAADDEGAGSARGLGLSATGRRRPTPQGAAAAGMSAPQGGGVAPAPAPPPVAVAAPRSPEARAVTREEATAEGATAEECAPSAEEVIAQAEQQLSSRENDCTLLCRLRTDVCQASRELCEMTDADDPRCAHGRGVCVRASEAARHCPLCPAGP